MDIYVTDVCWPYMYIKYICIYFDKIKFYDHISQRGSSMYQYKKNLKPVIFVFIPHNTYAESVFNNTLHKISFIFHVRYVKKRSVRVFDLYNAFLPFVCNHCILDINRLVVFVLHGFFVVVKIVSISCVKFFIHISLLSARPFSAAQTNFYH